MLANLEKRREDLPTLIIEAFCPKISIKTAFIAKVACKVSDFAEVSYFKKKSLFNVCSNIKPKQQFGLGCHLCFFFS